MGCRIDEDLGPEHGVGDAEKGVIEPPGIGDELEVGGQLSRKQEDPRQPVILIGICSRDSGKVRWRRR